MSIPQFKLEVVNGKLIRVPIKNIEPKAPPRDPEFDKIKGKFDFENLQRQLELDDRTDIIQDLDPATRRIKAYPLKKLWHYKEEDLTHQHQINYQRKISDMGKC